MLQEFVAPDVSVKSYKRRSSSSLSSISLSFLSPFSTLFHSPVVRLEFTDKACNMSSSGIKTSPIKPTSRKRRPVSTAPSMKLEHSTASSESHTRSISNAIRDVGRLPRKASRIVCIPGISCRKPHSPGDQCPSAVHPSRDSWRSGHGVASKGVVKERATMQAVSMERSGSQGSSGTGSTSIGSSTNSSSYAHDTSATSATSVTGSGSVKSTQSRRRGAGRNHPILPGPIMTPEELAKALERQSLETQQSPALNSASHISGWDTSLNSPNPNNNHTINFPDAEITTLEDEDFVPRPLSPPNFHFRRERVTSEAGTIVEPYTSPSPTQSPPGSPCFAQHQPQLRLHEVLSSEDLLATRMQLYNGALEPEDDCDSQREMWDAKSVKSDIGFSTRHRALSQCSPSTSGHTGIYSPKARREGKEKTSSYSTVRSHTRLRRPGVLIKEEDTNELRRVFSR